MLYPLKFQPRFVMPPQGQEGGGKLASLLGKHLPSGDLAAESWELVDFPPGFADAGSNWLSSTVADGPLAGQTLHQIIVDFGQAVHGNVPMMPPQGRFPIQVRIVESNHEMAPRVTTAATAWYVVQADPGARLVRNLRKNVEAGQLEQALAAGTFNSLCELIPAKSGDCLFLPPGTVHALGAGIVAHEIQTPADPPQPLGVPEALRLGLIRFGSNSATFQRRSHVAGLFTTVTRLITCADFILEKVRFVEGVEEAVPYDQPVVWIVLEGQAEIRVDGLKTPISFGRGDTLLIPAEMKNPVIKTLSNCVWLEVTFPKRPELP